MNFNPQFVLEQALKAGINPGECPVCKAGLMPSLWVPLAKVPEMSPAISFACPVDESHVEPENRVAYRVFKG